MMILVRWHSVKETLFPMQRATIVDDVKEEKNSVCTAHGAHQ